MRLHDEVIIFYRRNFFREYSGQIFPLCNFTGLKFVIVTSQLTVVWCEFLHVI